MAKMKKKDNSAIVQATEFPKELGDMLNTLCYETAPSKFVDQLKPICSSITNDSSMIELILRRVFLEAASGKQWAVNLVLERVFGKVADKVEVSVAPPIVKFPSNFTPGPHLVDEIIIEPAPELIEDGSKNDNSNK